MSQEVLGIVVNDLGIPVLPSESNPKGRVAFYKEFFKTPSGQRLAPFVNRGSEDRILTRVLAVHQRPDWFGSAEVTIATFGKVVDALIDAHDPEVVPQAPEPQPVAEDTRPRRNDGTFKSEFETFSETHSMQNIRARARTDEEFGAWFHAQVASQGIQQSEFTIVGEPTRTATSSERKELEEFARTFTLAPSSSFKPIAGRVAMAGKIYPYETFRSLVDKCSEIGLL